MKSLLLTLLLFSTSAFAEINWTPYSTAAFQQAKKSGHKIILGFHKKGCGTCHAQDAALSQAGIKKANNTTFLKVERKNPSHKNVYEKYGFNSRQWAAIVLLEGNKEITRINPGVTSKYEIKKFVSHLN